MTKEELMNYLNQIPDVVVTTNEDPVSFLVNQGLSANIKNKYGDSLLHIAATNGYDNAIKLLLAKNANLNVENYFLMTPLYIAAQKGHINILNQLLRKKANTENITKDKGFSALHIAVQNGHLEIVKALLEANNGLLKLRDSSGRSALDLAIILDKKSIFNELISNEQITEKDIITALKVAIERNKIDVVKDILSSRTELKTNLEEIKTEIVKALEIAIEQKKVDVVKDILSLSSMIKINLNDSIINIATNSSSEEISKIFTDIKFLYNSAAKKENLELLKKIEFPNVTYNNLDIFQTAIENNHYEVIEKMISSYPEIYSLEKTFEIAVEKKDKNLIKFVLSKDIDIDNLYLLATFNNNNQAIKVLLSENKEPIKTLSQIFDLCKAGKNYLPQFEILWKNVATQELAYNFLKQMSFDNESQINIAKIILNENKIDHVSLLNETIKDENNKLFEAILSLEKQSFKQDLLIDMIKKSSTETEDNKFKFSMIDALLKAGAKIDSNILTIALDSGDNDITTAILKTIKDKKNYSELLNQVVKDKNKRLINTLLDFDSTILSQPEQIVNLLKNTTDHLIIDEIFKKVNITEDLVSKLIAENNIEVIKNLLTKDNVVGISQILSFAATNNKIELIKSALNNKTINEEQVIVLLIEAVSQTKNIIAFNAIFEKFNKLNIPKEMKGIITNQLIKLLIPNRSSTAEENLSQKMLSSVLTEDQLYNVLTNKQLVKDPKQIKKILEYRTSDEIQRLFVEAIKNNNEELITSLLTEKLTIINVPLTLNNQNSTLLQIAIDYGNNKIVELLLNAKANVNATSVINSETNEETNALYRAIDKSDLNLVKKLLNSEANFESRIPILHNAIKLTAQDPTNTNKAGIVQLLLQQDKIKKIVNLQEGTQGKTPLHIAVEAGNKKIVEQLLKHNAIIGAKMKNGKTPLHVAAEAGNKELVELLLKHNAIIGSEMKNSYTPLDLAVKQGNIDIVKIFINNKKLDPKIKIKALEIAKSSNDQNPDLIKLIEKSIKPTDSEQKQKNLASKPTDSDYSNFLGFLSKKPPENPSSKNNKKPPNDKGSRYKI